MTKRRTTKRGQGRQKTYQELHLDLADIHPMTESQRKVFESTKNQVLHGCAGTGKTFITSYLAYKAIAAGEFSKLVYIRSAVSTRNIGFLPGTEAEKAAVYETPYKEITNELFDRGGTYDDLKKKGVVEFMTTSHVRGTTMNDTVVIVDECQNMSFHELDSIITRFGRDCRYYFCGDYKQADLKDSETGIRKFFKILEKLDQDFDSTEFTVEDIVRSELVKRYLIAKEKHESSTK